MKTYHEVLRHLTHVRDRIELYQLTPNKLEFDLRLNGLVTRESLLPKLKELEKELAQELEKTFEQPTPEKETVDIWKRYFEPAARSGTAELNTGAVQTARFFKLPEDKVGVVIVGISEEKPDGFISDAWKQVIQELAKVGRQEPEEG